MTDSRVFYLRDLPVGTKIIHKLIRDDKIDPFFIVHILKNNQYAWFDEDGNIQRSTISDIAHTRKMVSNECIIIYPHGHQSPLWKVLNGEEI